MKIYNLYSSRTPPQNYKQLQHNHIELDIIVSKFQKITIEKNEKT